MSKPETISIKCQSLFDTLHEMSKPVWLFSMNCQSQFSRKNNKKYFVVCCLAQIFGFPKKLYKDQDINTANFYLKCFVSQNHKIIELDQMQAGRKVLNVSCAYFMIGPGIWSLAKLGFLLHYMRNSVPVPIKLRMNISYTILHRIFPKYSDTFSLWCICYLFVLRFYGPVNPMGSCRARSVYLHVATRLLGRLSPLSGYPVLCTFFRQKLTTALLESAEGREWP